jgi:acyl carrier protein
LTVTVEETLIKCASRVLGVAVQDIDAETRLDECGFDLMKLTELCGEINENYNIELVPAIFNECSNIQGLARYLCKEYTKVISEKYKKEIQWKANRKAKENDERKRYSLDTFKEFNDIPASAPLNLNKVGLRKEPL